MVLSQYLRSTAAWIPVSSSLPRSDLRIFADASSSKIDPVANIPILEAEIAALAPDNAERKALEESLGDATTAAEFGVRSAQLAFYESFANHDYDAMGQVWSRSSHVRCVHPGMASLEGREEVMESWRKMFAGPSPPPTSPDGRAFDIDPERSRIEVSGQMAICSCVEKTPGGGKMEALNVYKRENGCWKMTLHMAGPIMVRFG